MDKINLVDIEKEIQNTKNDIDSENENHSQTISYLKNKMNGLLNNKNLLMNNYNANEIANAKNFIYTRGAKKNFYGDAIDELNDAIKDVSDGFKILKREYMGCKNYEGFIGQGVTCKYGYCPTYGSVVFEIGLKDNYTHNDIEISKEDSCDIIYYLNLLKDKSFRDKYLFDYE